MPYLEIDKKALIHNIQTIQSKLQDKSKYAIVLKDNAYGHGLDIVAPIAKANGVKHAVVRDVKEATYIQSLFETVLLLNPTKLKLPPHLHQSINDMQQIKIIKPGSSVELKVDTGMHRNGVSIEAIDEALQLIEDKKLVLRGIFTHYKSADMLTSEFFWQQKIFEAIKQKYKHLDLRFHSFNSAALFRAQNCCDDIARIGIASYGYIDYEKGLQAQELQPAMSLWAEKIATKKISKSQRVGYGGLFEAKQDCVVATYDAGYADGVFRSNPENPFTLANGEKIVGKVSMDSISAFGSEDRLCIFNDAQAFAKHFNTISYEVLVSMKDSLQRVQV
ncbi:MAG: alanine racemase [Campylobacterota bacterium]